MSKVDKLSQDNDTSMSQETEEEFDYGLMSGGPLYVSPEHFKPGFHYQFVSDQPGQIEMYKRWGFEPVIADHNVGDNTARSTTKFGSAITVQSKCGQLLVFMACPQEKFDKLMAFRAKQSKDRTSALGKIEGIPDHLQQFQGQNLGGLKITK